MKWNDSRCAAMMFSQLRITSLMFSAAVIMCLNSLKKELQYPHFLLVIGDYSFGVFFLHMFFVIPVGIILSHFESFIPAIIARYFQFITSMLGSLAVCLILHRLLGKKNSWLVGI